MVLVDSSVWISHFKKSNAALVNLLSDNDVIIHPFVWGEIALGSFAMRLEVLSLLRFLPRSVHASHEEVLDLVERNNLPGKGVGWIDAHLLASAALSGSKLWTLDKNLKRAAERLKVAFTS